MGDQNRTVVAFLNPHGPDLMNYLEQGLDGLPIQLRLPPDRERDSMLAILPDAHIVIGWGSDPEMLNTAVRMKLFINPGTGISQHLENFRELRKSRDVVLINGHGNSYSVAQHTVALLMALANRVIPFHQRMADGLPRGGVSGRNAYFRDITIGFLGYGAINTKVHRFLSGFDIMFAACRRNWDEGDPTPTPIKEYDTEHLSEFFEASDVVINALPATADTKEIVTMKELSLLGEGGLFLNVGRGSTVMQEDLYNALKDRVIAGAAIEVWWRRSPLGEGLDTERSDPYSFPFHELDNLVMSPHRGADSGGDLRRWDEVVENLKRFHAGRKDFLNVVDLDAEY